MSEGREEGRDAWMDHLNAVRHPSQRGTTGYLHPLPSESGLPWKRTVLRAEPMPTFTSFTSTFDKAASAGTDKHVYLR